MINPERTIDYQRTDPTRLPVVVSIVTASDRKSTAIKTGLFWEVYAPPLPSSIDFEARVIRTIDEFQTRIFATTLSRKTRAKPGPQSTIILRGRLPYRSQPRPTFPQRAGYKTGLLITDPLTEGCRVTPEPLRNV